MGNASAGIENGQAMFEAYRERFGLDDPLYIQYVQVHVEHAATSTFGESLSAYPCGSLGYRWSGHRVVDQFNWR